MTPTHDPAGRRKALRRSAFGLLAAPSLGVRRAAWASVGEAPAVNPPALLLAQPWPEDRSPEGFLVSEKFDGVRAHWDGVSLRLRGGGLIDAPAWFKARLPTQALDGELWLGPARFDEVSALLRRAAPDEAAWRAMHYLVFEAPGAPGRFDERAAHLQRLVADLGWSALRAIEQRPVADAPALRRWLDRVVGAGGEGLVLHRADALYQTGRAGVLYKHKPQHDDDGLVIGHQAGRGRLTGLTGALTLRLADGQRFNLGAGLTDAMRRQPPPVGSVVTFRHRGWTVGGCRGLPVFLRLREPGQ